MCSKPTGQVFGYDAGECPMNKIMARYVLKHFALTFFATLFILTSVIMLFDVIELLRDASKEENVSFFNVLVLAMLKSPQLIHIIVPFVCLLSGLIFLFRFDNAKFLFHYVHTSL